jgi:hypothetical protein
MTQQNATYLGDVCSNRLMGINQRYFSSTTTYF